MTERIVSRLGFGKQVSCPPWLSLTDPMNGMVLNLERKHVVGHGNLVGALGGMRNLVVAFSGI